MARLTSQRSRISRRGASRVVHGARSSRKPSGGSLILGNVAFLLFGLALLALGAAIVAAAQRMPSGSAAGASATTPTTGQQSPSGDWIPLRSTASADILAAARQSSMFQQNLAGSGDHVTDLSRLGQPALVTAIQPPGAAAGQFPDFYVVPILDVTGQATDAAELALNPSHTAIQVIAIVTYSQPHPNGAIPRMPSSAALATTSSQHVALRSGAAPRLVYFPADAAAQETGQVTWTGGGEYPADPIWLVPGADGRDHVVGVDGRVYAPDQLPMVREG